VRGRQSPTRSPAVPRSFRNYSARFKGPDCDFRNAALILVFAVLIARPIRSTNVVVRRELLRGLGRLNATTTVLQRARLADPLGGMWEAADVQWWWRRPRHLLELRLRMDRNRKERGRPHPPPARVRSGPGALRPASQADESDDHRGPVQRSTRSPRGANRRPRVLGTSRWIEGVKSRQSLTADETTSVGCRRRSSGSSTSVPVSAGSSTARAS
jgi:hypothetical protein